MSLKNTADRWGGVSQSLHWLIVLLVVGMAALGLSMTGLPDNAFKVRLYSLHKSIGLTILGLMLVRIAWRLYAGAPRMIASLPRWQHRIATATHAALYLLLIALPLSGWVINSSSGFPLRWFGWLRVPQFGSRDEALYALAKSWHEALFWALLVLALVHAFAAFWHHVFQQDATLSRMLPRRRSKEMSHDP